MKPATIVGWTGKGSLGCLERAVSNKLQAAAGETQRVGKTIVLQARDPVVATRRLGLLPGVSWVAAGYGFDGVREELEGLSRLAKVYLSRGSTFRVLAESEGGGETEGDILLSASSTILGSVPGARVAERRPGTTFRVSVKGSLGAYGVQLREGPGGVPTSGETKAACLVSGGYHSTAMAWMAALMGFSMTLVHARTDDVSLRQVAKLYSELSRRMDASMLELVVLDGGAPAGARLGGWLRRRKGLVMAGAHPECSGVETIKLAESSRDVLFPLLLVQEGQILEVQASLGVRDHGERGGSGLSGLRRPAEASVRSFGGEETDSNTVLDAMLR